MTGLVQSLKNGPRPRRLFFLTCIDTVSQYLLMSDQAGHLAKAKEFIKIHRLQPHPEGGFYAVTYVSDSRIASPFARGKREEEGKTEGRCSEGCSEDASLNARRPRQLLS